MEVKGQLRALAALLRGKEPRHLLARRLSEPQSRSGSGSVEKQKSMLLPGMEYPGHYIHLSYPGKFLN